MTVPPRQQPGGATAAALRVGVTGHRDLADPEAVAVAVDRALDTVAAPGRPLVAVSSLADGADRVVAHRVLARPAGRLSVVLPLPSEDYARDFDDASRQEFAGLLARADDVVVTGADEEGSRESAYERAGRLMVDSCDVLLALWDGLPSRGRGGTAEIVEHARAAGLPVVVVPVRRGTGPART